MEFVLTYLTLDYTNFKVLSRTSSSERGDLRCWCPWSIEFCLLPRDFYSFTSMKLIVLFLMYLSYKYFLMCGDRSRKWSVKETSCILLKSQIMFLNSSLASAITRIYQSRWKIGSCFTIKKKKRALCETLIMKQLFFLFNAINILVLCIWTESI